MVDLELVKQHLEYEDDDRDDLIEQYIAAAAEWVEGYTNLLLTRRAVTRRFSSDVNHFDIFLGPDAVIDSLKYLDGDLVEQTIDPADYALVDGRIYPASTFPEAKFGIVATITAGYDEGPPADLVSAQLLYIGHLFANRETVSEKPHSEVPMAAKLLCQRYFPMMV